MKARLKFTKTGCMKYIGHLDLLRLFQKAFRKVGFPVAYSSGFNPHPIISIAAPLSVGITSSGEYIDVKLNDSIHDDILKEMNEFLPEGVDFVGFIILEEKAKSAMAIVSAARYSIALKDTETIINEQLDEYLAQDEIMIMKKNKKKFTVEVNIKKGIYDLSLKNDHIEMLLATGSVLNVKPDAVLKTICEFLKIEYKPFDYKIHREDIYYSNEGQLLSLNA